MPRWLADGEISDENTNKGKQLLIRAGVLLLAVFFGFFLFRMMSKLNYRLYLLRQNFLPTIGVLLLIFLLLVVFFIFFTRLLNTSQRKGYHDEYEEDPKDEPVKKKRRESKKTSK